MFMARGKFKLFLSAVVALVLLLVLLKLVFTFSGTLWKLEFVGAGILAFIALMGLSLSKESCGERAMFLVSTLSIINLILLWYFVDLFSFSLILLSLLLLLLNFPSKKCSSCCSGNTCEVPSTPSEPHSEIFPDTTTEKKEELKVVKAAPKKKTASKTGRFVASSRSKIYHKPSCDWAKKINPKGKLTFKSQEEAWEKGFRAHDCVK